MKKLVSQRWIILPVIVVFVLSSCAPGNERFDADAAGFWAGLWHGFISLFTFIVSIFNESVNIYETENTGWPYNLGFILGIAIFYGGGSKGSCR